MGWIVLRFWGKEIKKNTSDCVNEIKEIIFEIESGIYRNKFNETDLVAAEIEPGYGNGKN